MHPARKLTQVITLDASLSQEPTKPERICHAVFWRLLLFRTQLGANLYLPMQL